MFSTKNRFLILTVDNAGNYQPVFPRVIHNMCGYLGLLNPDQVSDRSFLYIMAFVRFHLLAGLFYHSPLCLSVIGKQTT